MTATLSLLNPPHTSIQFSEYRAITLRILEPDIEGMEYQWNETPMCDINSNNAILSALSRIVRQNSGSLRLAIQNAQASVIIQNVSYPLGGQLSDWYRRANRGFRMKPVSSLIWLPGTLVNRRFVVY